MEANNAPTKCRQASLGKTKSPTSHLLPLTSYLLPPTSYLLPPTSYLLPLTSLRNFTTHVKKIGNDPREKDGKISTDAWRIPVVYRAHSWSLRYANLRHEDPPGIEDSTHSWSLRYANLRSQDPPKHRGFHG